MKTAASSRPIRHAPKYPPFHCKTCGATLPTGHCKPCYAKANKSSLILKRRALISRGKSICARCKQIRPLSEFGRVSNRRSGINSWCRTCISKNDHRRRYTGKNIDHATREKLESIGKKRCPKCKRALKLSDFHSSNGRRDGKDGMCADCRNRASRARFALNPDERRAYSRARYHTYGQDRGGVSAESRLAHAAHESLHRAVKQGRLIRSKDCKSCGANRRRIEGHHDDYKKPLVVVWLCGTCHKRMHAAHSKSARRNVRPSTFLAQIRES